MKYIIIIIPTSFASSTLSNYVNKLANFRALKELIIAVNSQTNKLKSLDSTKITTLLLGNNKGFTGACNAGAKTAKGDYLLFLNDAPTQP